MTINLTFDIDIEELDIEHRIIDNGTGGRHEDGSTEDLGKQVEINSILWGRREILWDLSEKEVERIREYLLERNE